MKTNRDIKQCIISTKKQIMDSNKFKRELVLINQSIKKLQEVKEYDTWVSKTNAKIAEINKRIRSTN